MKTVALFGGSFDPPHTGHIRIVEALQKLEFIDTVVVMPTYLNPFKSGFVADAATRLRWLKEIFADNTEVIVDDFEVQQQKKVPSIKSVEHLLEKYDRVYLVIGADNLKTLHTWYAFEALRKKVDFIVASRGNVEIPEGFIPLHVKEDISSSALRKKMQEEFLPQQVAQEIQTYYKEHNAKKQN